MCKLTLTAGLFLIIASLGYPGLTETAAVPPNFCNGKSNGQYTNPADPHSFYNCWDGTTYLQYCQSSLVFNQECSCCDYPATPPTTTTTPLTTTTAVTIPQTPIDNFCNGKSNGQYTNPADPHSFYNCWDGRTYLQYCPSSLDFNQKCSCCDYPVTALTTTTTPPDTTTTPPTTITTPPTTTTTPPTTTTTPPTTTRTPPTTTTTPPTTTKTPPTTTKIPPTTTTTHPYHKSPKHI
ncbi:integumentary mucin C.1-like [Sander lucioperca]|uniref:integumentary mucin C.1-like n=1 Tax=Sander lucioperca TaxID=283035 RepID=UPI0016539797|nr:integumentary mucin C.1-like [Sander lucioperca]